MLTMQETVVGECVCLAGLQVSFSKNGPSQSSGYLWFFKYFNIIVENSPFHP